MAWQVECKLQLLPVEFPKSSFLVQRCGFMIPHSQKSAKNLLALQVWHKASLYMWTVQFEFPFLRSLGYLELAQNFCCQTYAKASWEHENYHYLAIKKKKKILNRRSCFFKGSFDNLSVHSISKFLCSPQTCQICGWTLCQNFATSTDVPVMNFLGSSALY